MAISVEAMCEALDPLHAPVLFSVGPRVEADAVEHHRLGGRHDTSGADTPDPERLPASSTGSSSTIATSAGRPTPWRTGRSPRRSSRGCAVRRRPSSGTGRRSRGTNSGQPYPAAYARWREAETSLCRCPVPGGRRGALEALRPARDAALRLGARPLLQEIDSLAPGARLDLTPAPPSERARMPKTAEALGLTARELEVLSLLVQDLSDRQIGERLFISWRTAQVHVARIRAKRDVDNRTAAAGIAQRLGLISAPDADTAE